MDNIRTISWLLVACLFLTVAGRHGLAQKSRAKRQTEVLEDFCLHKKDGQIYPDPSDCRSYIFCSGGFGYRSKCAANLYYNPEVQTCDFSAGHCKNKDDKEQKMNTVKSKLSSTSSSSDIVDDPLRFKTSTLHKNTKPTASVSDYRAAEITVNDKGSLEKVDTTIDSMCKGKKDGTYPHPHDCHSYVYCSNEMTFPAICPGKLIYNHRLGGCDFDIDGICTPAYSRSGVGHTESYTQSSTYTQLSNSNGKVSIPENIIKELSLAMPETIENAMNMLTEKMQHEAEMAKHQTASNRPFKLVQVFLKARPLAKQLSMPAYILTTALQDLTEKYGNSLLGASAGRLNELSSPLPPNPHRIHSDDTQPQPDPGTCPWPSYNCRIEKYRSLDGSCNNLQNPIRGRAFTPFKRYLAPVYVDGMQSLRESVKGGPLPNARRISFTLAEDRDIPDHIQTVMLMQWGQFIDHDLTLTAISKISRDPSGYGKTEDIECGTDGCSTEIEACLPIFIPVNDPSFKSKKCLEFVRSQEVPSMNCTMGPRQQLNQITSYLDASNVYGSTKEDAEAIRDMTKKGRGLMKFTEHPYSKKLKYLLPQTTEFKECKKFIGKEQCFKAGDERVNEQGALTVMHTLWLREHNRIEEKLHEVNPHWDGETLYQETRRIVGAMVQHITYNEFLPTVLGPIEMRKHGLELISGGYYGGYNGSVDASIANVFATAAFRFGHTLIPHMMTRADTHYNTTAFGALRLSEMFFQPKHLYNMDTGGIDGFLRGMCDQKAQSFDRFVTKEVTKHLFTENPPTGLGTDLVSLNIMRARDHGIPGYNAWRSWCGLRKATDFDDFIDTMSQENIDILRLLYRHVDDVDIFPAGISERPVEGGLVGTTFACIIGRQFRDLRSGDRFWYENNGANRLTSGQLEEIRKVTLAKIICSNADDIHSIQPRVMELPFREAYPDNLYSTFKQKSGLNERWFSHLWLTHYNERVNCSCLPAINFDYWRET